MKFGLSAEARLHSPRQFDLIFRTGHRQTGRLVRLLFFESPTIDSTRFGVTVSKKIANAVKRVRGRRILREAIRRLKPWVKDGFWIVVSLRGAGLDVSAREIYFDLAKLMKRQDLLVSEWQNLDWDVDTTR